MVHSTMVGLGTAAIDLSRSGGIAVDCGEVSSGCEARPGGRAFVFLGKTHAKNAKTRRGQENRQFWDLVTG